MCKHLHIINYIDQFEGVLILLAFALFVSSSYQGGGYLLGCRSSIVFDGTGIPRIIRSIFFVPSDYRELSFDRFAC